MTISLSSALRGEQNEALNVAVCEALGWRQKEHFEQSFQKPGTKVSAGLRWFDSNNYPHRILPSHVDPSRIESLGNMALAEATLTYEQFILYINYLHRGDETFDTSRLAVSMSLACLRKLVSASSLHRAIAFLQVRNPEIFTK